MVEHVGKKRRKEVECALRMKHQLRSSIVIMVAICILGIIAVGGTSLLTFLGYIAQDNIIAQIIPLITAILVVLYLGQRLHAWFVLKNDYQQQCNKFNITDEDMQNCLKDKK